MVEKSRIDQEWELLDHTVARLRAGVMAVVFGMTCGCALFAATAWLLLRGGENVGAHLNLLGNYFPGYRVTWPGAFIGFFYAGITGAVIAWCVAWIYNVVVHWRRKEGEPE
ncbi:MAG: hypothetical protein C0404_14485 [Verrucomicrobia bacterium]|nr:hypothetical protein [Verrucomicrobiota bacterium]